MHSGPAILTIILQASHTATKEGCRLSITLDPSAFITHLSIKNIGFNFNLKKGEGMIKFSYWVMKY